MVAMFIVGNVLSRWSPASLRTNNLWRKAVASMRYVSYKSYSIRPLGWWSPPLGIMVLGGIATIFFFGTLTDSRSKGHPAY